MASVASQQSGRSARGVRYARRVAAASLYAGAVAVVYVLISPVLPDRSPQAGQPPAAQPATSRPASAPARIPGWAWDLHEWHRATPSERRARPAGAPRRVPAWYWDWHEWRLGASGGR